MRRHVTRYPRSRPRSTTGAATAYTSESPTVRMRPTAPESAPPAARNTAVSVTPAGPQWSGATSSIIRPDGSRSRTAATCCTCVPVGRNAAVARSRVRAPGARRNARTASSAAVFRVSVMSALALVCSMPAT
jgi:hypothetical protein